MRSSLFLCGLATLFLSGCFVAEKGSGVSATENREVDDFDSIDLSGSGDVHLVIGEPKSVTVTLDDNLIGRVKTEVSNGELRIYSRGSWSTRLGLKIEVRVPSLQAASVSGAGDLTIEGIEGDALDLEVSGAGDITASGSVGKLDINVSGAGEAHLKELQTKSVNATVSGAGDAVVFATEAVDARVSGSGDVEVFGNPPKVTESTSGVGDIVVRK